MAQKPYMIDHQQRELRQQSYLAAPSVGKKFPGVEELVVEMRFSDPDGKVHPSPHKRIFTADMQAFFELQCPLKDCSGGGYNLTTAIPKAVSGRAAEANGKLSCQGRRERDGVADHRCRLELQYHVSVVNVSVVSKRKAAA